ncbi:exopolyphosphatase [Spiribacter salilacus]
MSEEVAAIDLGSNSFHMIVARQEGDGLRVVDRLRESVRLAAGLNKKKQLDDDCRERALACLERFGQRVDGLPPANVRAVGTNTLRQLRRAGDFLEQAEQALGHSIQVISGYEEARLIYLGVAHSIADEAGQRLVIDIGGGSTELIIGEHFQPRVMESLHMGCVSTTQRHFADGLINSAQLRRARIAAEQELEPIADRYRKQGWDRVVGASGTIRAIARCLELQGWAAGEIHLEGLKQLSAALRQFDSVKAIDLKGISPARAEVLPGGLAVLMGIFEQLGIKRMEVADGALREGLLFDLVGRIHHEDVRMASVVALARRYHCDPLQAERVGRSAEHLRQKAAKAWGLDKGPFADLLSWAAQIHEVGLDISHSQFHKHGAYIVAHTDLAGFTRDEQQMLAALVRVHRRKFSQSVFSEFAERWQTPLARLAVILRLAVALHRARAVEVPSTLSLRVEGNALQLRLPADWLAGHPLLEADLAEEADMLAAAGFNLSVRTR